MALMKELRPTLPSLIGAAVMLGLSGGIRQSFGLIMPPLTRDIAVSVSEFALAMSVQNLAWGCIGILAGMLTDRFGAFRVLVGGALLYALGLAGTALPTTPLAFSLTAGVLIGAAQAGTTYAIVYGVIAVWLVSVWFFKSKLAVLVQPKQPEKKGWERQFDRWKARAAWLLKSRK